MKLTTEEKEFNKAMCTTCLLDWPMAKCLSCKFHIPEKEVDMNGWTPTVSKKVLDAIELATLTEFVKESPNNTYWQGRLESKRQEMEIEADNEWLDSRTDSDDPRTPEQIALDEWQAEVSATRESDHPF